MTKEDIFRIALFCFNINYDAIKEDQTDFTVSLCNSFLPAAESASARLFDWSFLLVRCKFCQSDRISYEDRFGQLEYCYDKPRDMMKPLYVNGEYNSSIKVIGDEIYFDVPDPELTYVTSKIDYDKFPYPNDYGFIIAYELAYELADMLMPEKASFKQGLAQKVDLRANLLRASDTEGNRERNRGLNWTGEIE